MRTALRITRLPNKKYDADFVRDHLQFKMGTENIGNAYEDGYDKSDLGKSVCQNHRMHV